MNILEQHIFDFHMQNINTKWEDFAKEVMAEQTPETFSMLYATDTHYIRKYAPNVPAYYKVKEMVDFSGYAGIDLLAITGDLVDGNTTISRQYRDLYDFVSLVRNSKTTSVLLSKGNHDDCSWYAYQHQLDSSNWISDEQWYTHVINPLRVQYPIVLDPENIAGGYYYIDYPLHKIRVININTNDIMNVPNADDILDDRENCGQWCQGLREKQLKWLKNALTFEEEGWSVMLMSHNFLISYGDEYEVHNGQAAWDMLVAFKNKQKGCIKNDEKYYEADFEYDFTDNKSCDVLPYIFGHCHKDNVLTFDGITAVSSQHIIGQTTRDFDTPLSEITGGWECMLLDKSKRVLKIKRFGIPEANRTVNY